MNVSVNNTEVFANPTDSIITISTWTASIVFFTLALFLTLKSRSNLNRVEFFILCTISLSNITSKLWYILLGISQFLFPISNRCGIISFGTLFLIFDFICCSTLFYYSIFQISSLSRAKLFLLVFDKAHIMRGFVIYQIVTIVMAILLNLVQWLDTFLRGCDYSQQSKYILIFYLVFFGPRVLIISSYSLATVYVFFTRFKQQSDKKRFRRNLNLILKFNLLSVMFIISYLPYMLSYIIDASTLLGSSSISALRLFTFYLPLLVYVVHPLLLIYVHNILKNTFKRLFFRAG